MTLAEIRHLPAHDDPTTDTPPRVDLPAAEVKALAVQEWRESGGTLTGAELARRHGRSERWGRQVIAAARQPGTARDGKPGTAPGGTAAPVDGTTGGTGGTPPAARPGKPGTTAPARPAARPGTDGKPPAAQARHRRRTAASPAVQRVTTVAVAVVALVAAVASYDHMRTLAVDAGEGWRAWLLPLSVDGLVVAASMTMRVRRRAGQRAGWLPSLSLLAGLAASLAANVAAAEPTVPGRMVAAWPAVALLLAHEMLDSHPEER